MNIKKSLFSILAVVMVFGFTSTASAQYVNYTWKTHGLKFQIHETMKVTESTGKKFVAKGGGVTLIIKAYEDYSKTANDVADAVYDGLPLTSKKIYSDYEVNNGGYKGYDIFGEGMQSGKKAKFICRGMIDPSGATNFEVSTMWWASNSGGLSKSDHIVKSFKKMK